MKIRLFLSQSNWFTDLTDKAKALYLKEHPDSKYAKQKLADPKSGSARKMDVRFIKDLNKFAEIFKLDPKSLFKHFTLEPSPPYDFVLNEVNHGVLTGRTLELSRSGLDAANKQGLIGTKVELVETK